MTNTAFTAANTMTLTNGGLTAKATASTADYARSADFKNSGKLYIEFTWDSSAGAAISAVGVADANRVYNSASPQTDALLVSGSGAVYANSAAVAAAALGAMAATNVVCCAVDFTNKMIWFRKGAAGIWNNAATADPATNLGGLSFNGIDFLAPFVQFGNTTDQVTLNAGDTAFAGAVPSGFTAGWPTGATTNMVASQVASEAWIVPTPDMMVSSLGLEIWSQTQNTASLAMFASQLALEIWTTTTTASRPANSGAVLLVGL